MEWRSYRRGNVVVIVVMITPNEITMEVMEVMVILSNDSTEVMISVTATNRIVAIVVINEEVNDVAIVVIVVVDDGTRITMIGRDEVRNTVQ